jgi:preprotein translocase SecE subunit
MADELTPDKKPKRRLKSAPESMRARLEQNTQKEKAKPKILKADKPKRKIFAPFRLIKRILKFIWRPFRWLGRHLIPKYFRSAFHELRLTTWPTRKQSRQLTVAVVIFSVIFGIFVSLLDYGLDKLFKEILVK